LVGCGVSESGGIEASREVISRLPAAAQLERDLDVNCSAVRARAAQIGRVNLAEALAARREAAS
jgi:hypothetical protein